MNKRSFYNCRQLFFFCLFVDFILQNKIKKKIFKKFHSTKLLMTFCGLMMLRSNIATADAGFHQFQMNLDRKSLENR